MPAMQARITALVVQVAKETLEGSGFTDVSLEPSTLSEPLLNWLNEGEEDYEADEVTEFARNIGYHRVKTAQGAFGIWFWPYIGLDLTDSGVDPSALFPSGPPADEDAEIRFFVPIDDDTFANLFKLFSHLVS